MGKKMETASRKKSCFRFKVCFFNVLLLANVFKTETQTRWQIFYSDAAAGAALWDQIVSIQGGRMQVSVVNSNIIAVDLLLFPTRPNLNGNGKRQAKNQDIRKGVISITLKQIQILTL